MSMNPGRYLALVAAHGISHNEGKQPQLWVSFQNENGESISWFSGMGYNGRGEFSEKAFAYCCKALGGLGWDAEAMGYDFGPLALGECLTGREAQITVADDEYQGVTRTKVKYIDDPNAVQTFSTIDPKQESTFFSQLRARAFQAKAGGGQSRPAQAARPAQQPPRQQPPQQEEPTFIDIGDVPF